MMGLFSKIANVAKTVVTQPVKSFVEGAKATAVVVSNPITTISKGYTAAKEKTQSASLTTNITKIVTNTAAVAVPLAKPKLVVAAAKAIIPQTPKGKVIGGAAALVAAGAVAQNPIKAAEIVQDAPSALTNIGANTANLVQNPSIDAAKKIITDNPVATSILGAAVLAPVIPATIIGASNILDNDKVASMPKDTSPAAPVDQIIPKDTSPAAPMIATNPTAPQTAQTQRIVSTSSSTTSAKRRKKNIKPTTISQKVNLVVNNNNANVTKRYIKKEVMLK